MRELPHIAENFKIAILKHVIAIAPTPFLPTPLTRSKVQERKPHDCSMPVMFKVSRCLFGRATFDC